MLELYIGFFFNLYSFFALCLHFHNFFWQIVFLYLQIISHFFSNYQSFFCFVLFLVYTKYIFSNFSFFLLYNVSIICKTNWIEFKDNIITDEKPCHFKIWQFVGLWLCKQKKYPYNTPNDVPGYNKIIWKKFRIILFLFSGKVRFLIYRHHHSFYQATIVSVRLPWLLDGVIGLL